MSSDLEILCENAMRAGRQIDLTGCSYGMRFLKKEFVEAPVGYYFFLAGLVRTLDLKRVLELGTHWGGAIMSMWRGLRDPNNPENQLVTVDIACKNAEGFTSYPKIKRITGDSFNRSVLEQVVESFYRPIDLLFVDTEHEYRRTYRSVATYANRLAPRFVLLDDIHFNRSMERFWFDLKRSLGDRAFDASRLCNRENAGFGVVLWDPNVHWPERYAFLTDYWRARRWMTGQIPARVKDWIRSD